MPSLLVLVFGALSFTWWCLRDRFAVAEPLSDVHPKTAVETAAETPEFPKTSNCFVFTHLQKSGGSTIKRILHHWGEYPMVLYGSHEWIRGEEWRDLFVERVSSSEGSIVVGDTTEALRYVAATPKDCLWFTMFRHPISRVVSAFFFCHLHPRDPLCGSTTMPVEAHTDIVAFAKHWGNYALRQFIFGMVPTGEVFDYAKTLSVENVITWNKHGTSEWDDIAPWYLLKMYLQNDGKTGDEMNAPEPDEVMYDMLQSAKNLLRERYVAVGILEEFDMTLDLFDAALSVPGVGWNEIFAQSGVKNEDSELKREEDKVMAEAWDNVELKSYIHLDILLYEHAVDVFHEQGRAHGVV